jgi:hypothetical protein
MTCIVVVAPHVATRTGIALARRRINWRVLENGDYRGAGRRRGAAPPGGKGRHCQQAGSVGVRRAEPLARLRVVVCQRRPAGLGP